MENYINFIPGLVQSKSLSIDLDGHWIEHTE